MIKLIALDLDGTLLDDRKQIDPETAEYIRKIHESYGILLISGRHLNEIMDYARVLQLTRKDFIVACDGLYIHNGEGSLVKTFKFLNTRDVYRLSEMQWKDYRLNYYTEYRNYRIVDYTITGLLRYLYTKVRYAHKRFIVFPHQIKHREKDGRIEKFAAIPKSSRAVMEEYDLNLYTVHRLQNGTIEILATNSNKYNAVKNILLLTGMKADEILYFGDDSNDMECAEKLPYFVSMGNALDLIKTKAVYVTASNNDQGVLKGLKNILNGNALNIRWGKE